MQKYRANLAKEQKLNAFKNNRELGENITKGKPELAKEWDVQIDEGGALYDLHLKLYKSTLKISDDEGNTINVDKRKGKILIEHWGKVEFHHEELHP